MKQILLVFVLAVLILVAGGCKKSESESPTSPETTDNYFPDKEGSNFKYSYLRIDSTGQHTGTRNTIYKGSTTILTTPYKIQIDSLNLNAVLQVDSSYFRTTTIGTYYYLDTTGFVESITDPSLIPLIPLVTIDKELLAYSSSLQAGKNWTVFKINLSSTTVVDVSAIVIGSEPIILNLLSGQTNKDALKIRFTLTLRLNPFSTVTQAYTADTWLIKDIGPAKWDGSGTIVNFFTGLGIDFGDTTTMVRQSLIDYQIK